MKVFYDPFRPRRSIRHVQTREQLRELARKNNIPRGRNTGDTVHNLREAGLLPTCMNLTDRPTPRTDAEAYEPNGGGEWVVGVPFARDLEQQVSALREALEKYRGQIANDGQAGYAEETLTTTEPKA